jgi:translation elongation factor EF-1alpha
MDNQAQHKQRQLITVLGPVAEKTFFTSQLSIYRGLVKQSNVARVETTNTIITLFDTTYNYMCRIRHKVSLLSITDHVIIRVSENSPWTAIPTYILLAYSRGFSSVIVIVNYDAATYSKQIHEDMANKILDATNKYYTYDRVTIIPLIMQQDFQAEYPDWYRGTTLIQALDNLPARPYGNHKDSFRMIIQKRYKQVLVGRVCSGSINVRDPLVCQFSGRIGNIHQDGKQVKVERTGDYVGIILQYCSRSDRVVFAHGKLPPYTNTFIVQAQVVENRLQVGRVFLVCAASYYRN